MREVNPWLAICVLAGFTQAYLPCEQARGPFFVAPAFQNPKHAQQILPAYCSAVLERWVLSSAKMRPDIGPRPSEPMTCATRGHG
jgi:hypothetical protein